MPHCITPAPDCQAQNLHHSRLFPGWRNTSSGIKNVNWDKFVNKWKVRVKYQEVVYNGGYYEDLSHAALAASLLRQRLHKCCPENSLPPIG